MRSRSSRRALGALLVPVLAVGLGVADIDGAAAAAGEYDGPVVGRALIADQSTLLASVFTEYPPNGSPTMASATPVSSFPQAGNSYAVLSTGNAYALTDPSLSTSATNGGASIRGGAYDTVVLAVVADVPAGRNCARVDFRFLSEEYPEWVGSSYNDAFIIELDQTTWTASGSAGIQAPDNFAFDPTGAPITINATGATSMTASDAAGTTYDGATPLLTAATPISAGMHTFYFSIFDQGDAALDSTALIDNLRFTSVSNPTTECRTGAMPSAEDTAAPLLAAHGITGNAQDLNANLDLAQDLIPTLTRTLSSATAPIGSVWQNGAHLQGDAQDLTSETGQPRVNAIAHSKGGLDTQVAMWRSPQLFGSLGMLATPNAGSKGADNLCMLRRAGFDSVVANQGPCDNQFQGLYNLQTAYVTQVFDEIVRDWPQHQKYVVAGDCSSAMCTAMRYTLASCSDADLQVVEEGSDSVVCVSSAFARTALVRQDGLAGGTDQALLPVYSLDHSGMRAAECPTSRVLQAQYGRRNVGNPYSSSASCTEPGSDPTPSPSPGPVASTSSLAASTVTAPDADGTLVRQTLGGVKVDAGTASRLEVVPEATGDLVVELLTDTPVDVTVLFADGSPDGSASVETLEDDGVRTTVVTIPGGATASARTLELSSGTDTWVGMFTSVPAGNVQLEAEIEILGPGQGLVRATVTGAPADTLAASELTATVGISGAAVDVTLEPTDVPGVYEGTVALNPGEWTPVDVQLRGPVSRLVTTGAVTEDGSGQILGVVGDRLVDSDADGALDSLAVDVAVDVDVAGTYDLAADFSTTDGVAFSAPAGADLAAGEQTLTLLAPVAALLAGGADGPYEVTHGVLSRTTDGAPVRVDTADSLGSVGAYPASSLPADTLGLYRTDLDQDAAGTSLVITARAAVVTAGTYRLVGTLTASDGSVVELGSTDLDLPSGVTEVALSFHANGLAAGEYTVSDLTLTSADDPSDEARGPVASHVLTMVDEPQDPDRPVLRSRDSLTLTNQFRTLGTDGDVITDGDFICNSSVHVQGDVIAAGDVSMTNECRIDGDLRAGGSISMNSSAAVGGDVTAVGDVFVQESVTVSGSILSGGSVTSIDARTIALLQDAGAIGGTVTQGAPVDPPSMPERLTADDLGSPWPGLAALTWQQWLNQTATANGAPSWSQGLTSTPGCVMAPWGASVGGEHVSIATATVVDALTETSGCFGVTLQGMTLDLGADLVLRADRLSLVNGLTVDSADGAEHLLQIVIPSEEGGAISVQATNGITASPQVQVQVVTDGGIQIDGATSMTALLDVGFLRTSGAVDIARPGTA